MTSEMAPTKKRRKYMGPVPKPAVLNVITQTDKGPVVIERELGTPQPKRRGRPPKVASGNNPT